MFPNIKKWGTHASSENAHSCPYGSAAFVFPPHLDVIHGSLAMT